MEFRDGPSAQKAMLRLNGKIIPNSQPVGETIVIENRYHLPCRRFEDNLISFLISSYYIKRRI